MLFIRFYGTSYTYVYAYMTIMCIWNSWAIHSGAWKSLLQCTRNVTINYFHCWVVQEHKWMDQRRWRRRRYPNAMLQRIGGEQDKKKIKRKTHKRAGIWCHFEMVCVCVSLRLVFENVYIAYAVCKLRDNLCKCFWLLLLLLLLLLLPFSNVSLSPAFRLQF